MPQPLKTVAVLVATPALCSILSMTLAGVPSLRVRPFESEAALLAYMRVAAVHLVVTDFDSQPARADRVAEHLRADPRISRHLQIIALASQRSLESQAMSNAVGIDEIMMKPMSPRYLVERTIARLASPSPPGRRMPASRDWSRFGDNIVPLLPRAPETLH